jgi:L-asparaginase II
LRDPSAVLPEDAPLAAARRDALVESVHRGRVAVCDPAGEVLDAVGDPEGYVYFRSSAKPFQALPLVLSGAADALRLSDEELAVACASHNAEARHLSAVRSILRKAGLSEDALQSGAHSPLHAPAAVRLARSGDEPRPIHGNCSGKHAGMLALCVHEGWDITGYRKPDHPAQQKILGCVAEICGAQGDEILVAGDNCGVPAFALPLKNLAIGFARLASGEELSDELAGAARRIRDAMRSHPFMVAGTGRFDTELMQDTDLVAKSGAEAVFACGGPEGWGMAIKVSDGSARAVRPVALSALSRQGVRTPGGVTSELRDLHGARVGEMGTLP